MNTRTKTKGETMEREEIYFGLTFKISENTVHYEKRLATYDKTDVRCDVLFGGLQISEFFDSYYENVVKNENEEDYYDSVDEWCSHTKAKAESELAQFLEDWKHDYDNKDTDARVYIINDEYETDGGFGDAIPQVWAIGSVQGHLNAAWYCAKYTDEVVIDKPYDDLMDGRLGYQEIPALLNINIKPFTTEKADDECFIVKWNEKRFKEN